MTFGERIQTLKKKQDLSQEELANKIDVSRQAISKWESNQSNPDIETLWL
ncbi:helix-turn-helix domain-containing protein [Facklamia sp. 7083-14-GEN3]|nr:helix-turn-helix transcriptional regulator [Facklamia sp. 7083-14-GEN3]MCR8968522.1 helix-turn-helix domain-containing protein [Facklamia sp. 7083-14-GEN3]